ncbi:LamG-like jellyroll fold domain-containing protein [Victivallis vadensis]|uniref:LamG-like jellyroll fold domain-containing protein n=1 Tax=Victivallis vadensis TaxID=172901 RepID=UPI000D7B6DF3|nr:LamG-like jellyroll fold domain-containing protein [Victivallis vadensis]PWM75336.1 MAG: hypothetical protein DBX90_12880 [Lentisphaerota bacterium]
MMWNAVFRFLSVIGLLALAAAGADRAPLEVELESGKPFSIGFLTYIDRYPDDGAGRWDRESPMTVWKLEGAPGGMELFLRLNKKRPILTFFGKKSGVNRTFDALSELPPGAWYWLGVTSDGKGEYRLYVNGTLDGCFRFPVPAAAFRRLLPGSDGGGRRLAGRIGETVVARREIPEKEWKALFGKLPEELRSRSVPVRPRQPLRGGGDYPCLQVGEESFHAFIDQLHIGATAVPWFDPQGRDLLVHGNLRSQGGRVAVHRFLGVHDGLPVYDGGTTVENLAGRMFRAVRRGNGLFDLYAQGKDTVYGNGSLILYRNRGRAGAPEFAEPEQVLFGEKTLAEFLGKRSLAGWELACGESGAPSAMLMAVSAGPGGGRFPFEGSPWTGKEQKFAGPGKGYDVLGNWLGNPGVTEVLVADAVTAAGGMRFGEPRPVWLERPGFPVTMKGDGGRALNVVVLAGKPHLVLAGDVDQAVAMPLEVKDGEWLCGRPRPLCEDGRTLRDTYYPSRIIPMDYDGDGVTELLLDGNPGRVAVLKPAPDGTVRQLGGALRKGGDLAVETLASPWRIDWDGDGKPDLLTGDSSGYLTFWPGTADPLKYGAPVRMKSAGREIHVVAGLTGSIQGPSEKRWGYLKVAAGSWGGTAAVITNDIEGRLTLYRKGSAPMELGPGTEFTLNGRPFRAAWRARADILPASAGFGKEALLILDWDGDAAVAVPAVPGGCDFAEVIKLRYEDGEPVRLCGPAGLWGRAAMTVTDWDGDGRWDILFGTNSSCHRFFSDEAAKRGAMPFFLRNVGIASEPRFARPVPVRQSNGEWIELGNHNATPCVTDLDGNGRPDLLVGAEDGKVYYFLDPR